MCRILRPADDEAAPHSLDKGPDFVSRRGAEAQAPPLRNRECAGFCVLPMANRRRRTVCTSSRRNEVLAQKMCLYLGRIRFRSSISPSKYVLAARERS